MPKEQRKRNWVFVVYPDSAPENWVEKLREMRVPGFISPLHDKDVNPDGEPKKVLQPNQRNNGRIKRNNTARM